MRTFDQEKRCVLRQGGMRTSKTQNHAYEPETHKSHEYEQEPSLIKWAEGVKSKRKERTFIRSSPRRSHQSNGAVENYQKQLQGQVCTMLAALPERTQHRQTTDKALMK